MYIAEWENNEKTIIKQTIMGRLEAEEMRQGFVQLWDLLDSVDHDVIMMTTVDEWIWLPKDFGIIAREFDMNIRNNLVLQIIIGNNLSLRVGLNLGSIVAPQSFKKTRVVKNEEDAYKLIAKYQQGSPV